VTMSGQNFDSAARPPVNFEADFRATRGPN
jgi:hypothetical protein